MGRVTTPKGKVSYPDGISPKCFPHYYMEETCKDS